MQFYSAFEERGYRIEAYIPDSDDEPVAFEIRILIDQDVRKDLLLPITHAPVFGVDVDDLALLEAFADQLMKLLPSPVAFDTGTEAVLEELERRYGGQVERVSAALRQARSNEGDFAYTESLLAATFSRMLGIDATVWLHQPAAELGNKTPLQALRSGEIREVLAYAER